jgi:hypothetical protein
MSVNAFPLICYFGTLAVAWTLADLANRPLIRAVPNEDRTAPGEAGAARSIALLVFPHGYRSYVADSAVRPRLWRVNRCAAPATPLHMPPIACAPHRTH